MNSLFLVMIQTRSVEKLKGVVYQQEANKI